MRLRTRVTAITIAVLTAVAVTPASAGAAGGPGSGVGMVHPVRVSAGGESVNTAQAHNGGHGRVVVTGRTAVVVTDADVVDATNRAAAVSRCENCRTVAVAFDVVLAGNTPHDLAFTNSASAVNLGCRHCETLAMAYQFAVVSPGVTLTPSGATRLAAVNTRLQDLIRSGAATDDVVTGVSALAAEVATILHEDLTTGTAAGGPSLRAQMYGHPRVEVRRAVESH